MNDDACSSVSSSPVVVAGCLGSGVSGRNSLRLCSLLLLLIHFSRFFVTTELLLSSASVTPSGTYLFGLVESISSNLDASGSPADEMRVTSDDTKDSFCLSVYTGREVLRVVEMAGVLLTPVVTTERVSTFKPAGKLSEMALLDPLPGFESASSFSLRGGDVGLGLFSVARNLSASNLVLSRVACSSASFLLAAAVLGLAVGSVCFVDGVRGLADASGSAAAGDRIASGAGGCLPGLVGSSWPELLLCFITPLDGREDSTITDSLCSDLL